MSTVSGILCRQLQASTGIDFCLHCYFVDESRESLVICKAGLLQVYRTINQAQNKTNLPVLQLCLETKIFGVIQSINKVRLPGRKRDSLVLSFDNAKVSVIDYDKFSHSTRVNTLHYFESEVLENWRREDSAGPELRIDPQGRVAVMLIYGTKLAVIPFRRGNSRKRSAQAMEESASFLLDLSQDLPNIKNIKDYVFLEGYYEPTLMILHEPAATATGRLGALKDTCCVTAVTLGLNRNNRQNPIIWSVDHLPYDCWSLNRGVIVIGTNHFLYLNQNSRFAVGLNDFANSTATLDIVRPNIVPITLDSSVATFLTPNRMLISIKTGELYFFHLHADARNIKEVVITKAGASICPLSPHYVFLGSRSGDSQLIQYTRVTESKQMEEDLQQNEQGKVNGISEREFMEEDDMRIYSSAVQQVQSKREDWELKLTVVDRISSIGSINDFLITESTDSATISHTEANAQSRSRSDPSYQVVACTGLGKNGSLTIMQNGVRPEAVEKNTAVLVKDEQSGLREEPGEGFHTRGTTLNVGNMNTPDGHIRICQIFDKTIRLLNGKKKITDYTISSEIISSSISAGYVLLLLSDKSLLLLQMNREGTHLVKMPTDHLKVEGESIMCCSLYMDNEAFFGEEIEEPDAPGDTPQQKESQNLEDDMDEEDRLLYGGNKTTVTMQKERKRERVKRMILVICRGNIRLEMYSIPEMKRVFHYNELLRFPYVISPTSERNPQKKKENTTQPDFFARQHDKSSTDVVIVKEITIATDETMTQPFLAMVLGTNDIILYRGSRDFSDPSDGGRFIKIEHEFITRRTDRASRYRSSNYRYPKIFPFDNVGEKRGIFISGYRPILITSERSYPRLHSMHLDGEISWFAEMNNEEFPHSFVYYSARITHHPVTKSYAIILSTRVPRVAEVEDYTAEEPTKPDPLILYDDLFSLRLVVPSIDMDNGWPIADNYEFEPNEHVLSISYCLLKCNDDQTHKGGTGYIQNEDVPCKGRIVIFDIIPVENQYHDKASGDEAPKPKLKTVYAKEQKGAVSVVSHVSGYLLVCVGPKILLYNFSDSKELVGVAFYDAQVFIVNMTAVKNFILCSDIYNSVFFVRWKEDEKKMILLGRENSRLPIVTSEYLLNEHDLLLLGADQRNNLSAFSYAPAAGENKTLICRSDFHLGSVVTKFTRMSMGAPGKHVHANLFGTLDGGLGLVTPMEEVVYQRLLSLQSRLNSMIPHTAGLNPRGYRATGRRKMTRNEARNDMLDGDLIWQYLSLDHIDQRRLARAIGTTQEQILRNMMDIDLCLSIF
ncbi:cleavage and polyadenylation specificity factor subunit 1-like [Planoprotostelium fungivorum]|uniref:Cleavage and polyadenylation specificity factor subunit 1-like n=1 Tax=Planoprotostelium fungivorum TaxID=1890364 RepID=A0A2P6N721_9EUKA|nr:cleavage and polyadenylation specificity factor subunit 1-like [Planoprotostelium fungivorum]